MIAHQWEPDFSEGEPALDSKICGLCGEEHLPRSERGQQPKLVQEGWRSDGQLADQGRKI